MSRKLSTLVLAIIVGIGAIFRFIGVNWDSGAHLHPDERFLTMVGVAMKIPASFATYLDPLTSSMNPANIGYTFYVYGLAPLTFNKILAVLSESDTYQLFVLQGRIFSAFIDVLAVVFIYKIVELIERYYNLHHKSLKYWAAFIYAVSVLPIQLSHFFAVDTFLNTFGLMSVYFIMKVLLMHHEENRQEMWRIVTYSILSGVFMGLALSSKVTAVFMIPLMGGLAIATYHKKFNWWFMLPMAALWLIFAYFTVRIANPYMFESGNMFDLNLSDLYLRNLHELKSYEDPNSYFPPIVQWSHTQPIVYSLFNLFMFSYGPVATLLSVAGGILVFRRRQYVLWVLTIFTLAFFMYQSTRMTQPVRYYNIIFPYLAILAAIAIVYTGDILKKKRNLIFIPLLLFWPVAFLSIFVQPHSRITASRWIYKTIPVGSVIAVEHWDDALPISVDANITQSYIHSELPVFAPDYDPNKWNELHDKLDKADYYILSSNRAWRSVMNAPDKYPYMSQFYRDLFAGRNKRYKLYGHFTSYPSYRYLGIPIDFSDNIADETFTVYDHPEVYVFKRL